METSITSQRLVKMRCIYPLIMFTMLLKCSNGQQNYQRYHLSPEQSGLRPATNPADIVPIPPLIESSIDIPTIKDRNLTLLFKKLGPHFDSNFMSINPPDEKDNNVSNFGYRRSHLGRLIPTGTMPEYLNKMDFKHVTLSNGSKLKTKISPKLKKKIQQFLWAQTACPVVYKWTDLTERFWPQWLKIGECPVNISCSIPPGMTCSPSKRTQKKLLFWHCTKYSSSSNDRSQCKWIKIWHPVLVECSCSCSSSKNNDY